MAKDTKETKENKFEQASKNPIKEAKAAIEDLEKRLFDLKKEFSSVVFDNLPADIRKAKWFAVVKNGVDIFVISEDETPEALKMLTESTDQQVGFFPVTKSGRTWFHWKGGLKGGAWFVINAAMNHDSTEEVKAIMKIIARKIDWSQIEKLPAGLRQDQVRNITNMMKVELNS